MEEKKRIVIAEDHAIIREALKKLLDSHEVLAVVGEAEDGREAIQLVERLEPDLIMLDLSMPKMNGTEAIREIKERFPKTKVLVLTMHKTEDQVLLALRAGADGFLLKDDTHSELLIALESVLMGKAYLSPAISRRVIQSYVAESKDSETKTAWNAVTQRERQVLKLVAEGYKNKDIAEELCISVKTVEKHRSNLRQKLDLHSTLDFMKYALERGLIDT